MDTTDDKREKEWPEEDEVVFVPDEVYRDFFSALDRMERARKEFERIAERTSQTES